MADEVWRSHGERARPRDQEGQRKVRDDRIASYYCFIVAGDSKLWWYVRPNLHGNRQELLVDCERITGNSDVMPLGKG